MYVLYPSNYSVILYAQCNSPHAAIGVIHFCTCIIIIILCNSITDKQREI